MKKFSKTSLLPLYKEEKKQRKRYSKRSIKKRIKLINKDFERAFKLIKEHNDTVTFFGSARFKENNPYYKQARKLAKRVSEELGLTVVSGGGPGIMEAANRGANDASGKSVGALIELPHEQVTNGYANYTADFYYFFSRKVALAFSARAYVYFPGGFGTLDELFEILTLKQTNKIPDIPIILCGSKYWKPLLSYIEKTVYLENKAIDKKDMQLYSLCDNEDTILEIIKKSDPYKHK